MRKRVYLDYMGEHPLTRPGDPGATISPGDGDRNEQFIIMLDGEKVFSTNELALMQQPLAQMNAESSRVSATAA